jgi:hypothetical protein
MKFSTILSFLWKRFGFNKCTKALKHNAKQDLQIFLLEFKICSLVIVFSEMLLLRRLTLHTKYPMADIYYLYLL